MGNIMRIPKWRVLEKGQHCSMCGGPKDTPEKMTVTVGFESRFNTLEPITITVCSEKCFRAFFESILRSVDRAKRRKEIGIGG